MNRRRLLKTLDAQPRADLLAKHAQAILNDAAQTRSKLAPADRPSVYLARSNDSLETGLTGSIHGQAFEMAGARNVAHTPASSGVGRVSMEQILAWNPDYIFTQNPAFVQHAQTITHLEAGSCRTGTTPVPDPHAALRLA